MVPARVLLLLVAVLSLAGCGAEGATAGNFSLKPQRVGWFVGEEAHFVLSLEPTLFRDQPTFTLDPHFALEEVRFSEKGLSFGGDYKTRNAGDVGLRLVQDNQTMDEVVLNATSPSVDVYLRVPEGLKDSQYVLELKLFKVGRIKSDPFRVDRP